MTEYNKGILTLITGSSGFLGSKLHHQKSSSGINDLRLFDKDTPTLPSENFSNVFHLAALVNYNIQESKALFENNVLFTESICKKYPDSKIVLSSTVSVYPISKIELTELSQVGTTKPYALSKLWAEQIVKTQNKYSIIRFSSLYGENMKETTLIPIYVNQALKDGIIEVWGDGSRRQNYIHVDDACNLLEAAMKNKTNGLYLGVGEKEWSNLEIAEIIGGEIGAKIKFVGEDQSPSFKYNNEITRSNLDWMSKTNLEIGIKQYIKWKRKSY